MIEICSKEIQKILHSKQAIVVPSLRDLVYVERIRSYTRPSVDLPF
jgi:hypothetical protein